ARGSECLLHRGQLCFQLGQLPFLVRAETGGLISIVKRGDLTLQVLHLRIAAKQDLQGGRRSVLVDQQILVDGVVAEFVLERGCADPARLDGQLRKVDVAPAQIRRLGEYRHVEDRAYGLHTLQSQQFVAEFAQRGECRL